MTEITSEFGGPPRALTSPDQLDQRIVLVPTGHRIMASGLALVIGAVAIWGVLGSVPSYVSGSGILVSAAEQMFPIATTTTGVVREIQVRPGDRVSVNQPIIVLDQPELVEQVDHAKRRLAELEGTLASVRQQTDKERAERRRQTDAQFQSLTLQIRQARERRDRLARLLADQEELLRRGYARKLDVEQQRQNRDQATADVIQAQSQWTQAQGALIEFEDQLAGRITDAEQRVSDQRDQVDLLVTKLKTASTIHSPYEGTVEEVRINNGGVVRPGDVLATVADGVRGYEMLAFLEPYQGKQVTPGMAVHIVPGTVKKEEFGAMRGTVAAVSERPVSEPEINALLRNPTLTQLFVKNGPPLFVRVRLAEDPTTPSGFAWWAGRGPPFAIGIGTLAAADVVVRETPPVALILPYLKHVLGL